MDSIRSLRSAYERLWNIGRVAYGRAKTIYAICALSFQPVHVGNSYTGNIIPGGYCVIEQIGHLIYGMVATGLVEELDIKVIFEPALTTIAYMKMRQHNLAGWILAELAKRGIDPRDASIWAEYYLYATDRRRQERFFGIPCASIGRYGNNDFTDI